jgi:hypothetical protein
MRHQTNGGQNQKLAT